MSILEYISNLNRIKADALSRFDNLNETEKQVIDGSYEWLVNNLEIKRGEIQSNEDLTKNMDEFLRAVVEIIHSSESYTSSLNSYLSDLSQIQKNNRAFHSTYNSFDINTAGVKETQKIVVNEVLNQYLENGLNENFAIPLRDLIYRNVLAGMNMKQAKQVLTNYILSGKDGSGKLQKYVTQTAQQGVDSYSGAINMQLKKEFTFTGYIISGSIIETSSIQCIDALAEAEGGYLTFKEWEGILTIARNNKKAPLIPGTNLDNLPLNKLHWGCRHEFSPVIKNK